MNKTIKRYWKDTILFSEELTQREVDIIVSQLNTVYVRAYKEILNELNNVMVSTKNESQRAILEKNLNKLNKAIDTVLKETSETTEEMTRELLEGVYVRVRAETNAGFSSELFKPSKNQVTAVVNAQFHGSTFSKRVWTNNDAIATRIKRDLGQLILEGKAPQEITKALQDDFNVAYYQADRLVRTEASRVFNQATTDTYEEYGVTRQEYLAENDSCADCQALDGEVYLLKESPTLPQHPNCRCTYIPVISGYQRKR